jgi:GT2 family glycosyltransferase
VERYKQAIFHSPTFRIFTGNTYLPSVKKAPTVAVVILNWNGHDYLARFLPSVLSSTYKPIKWVVADNASTDESVAFIRNTYPDVEILQNLQNMGYAGGYNWALQQVQADYYLLLNSDVEVTPGWIEPLIQTMEQNQRVAACQPKIRSIHQPDQFEYAGACGGWIDALGYPFARGRVLDDCERDEGQYDSIEPCFWATGAALCIRADLFHEAGGFDARFFAHQEEIDLCWRLQRMGFQIYVNPFSVVYHVGGGTLPKGNSSKVYLNVRNNWLMMFKNLSYGEMIWKVPMRLLLDALAAWKALLTGDSGFWIAVFRAHWFVITKGWSYLKPNALPRYAMSALTGSTSRWLVVEFYLKKRRHFSAVIGRK